MTELLLIRHAESEGNTGQSSDPDCRLTDRGRGQARDLARQLAAADVGGFDAVCSPYRRTVDTAGLIAGTTGLRFAIDPAVREWGPTATVDRQHYPPEPIAAVIERLSGFLDRCRGRRVVVVSHAAPIALLTELAWGEPPTTEGRFWVGVGNCRPRWVRMVG